MSESELDDIRRRLALGARKAELLTRWPGTMTAIEVCCDDDLCELIGWNPWCVNEGQCDSDEQIDVRSLLLEAIRREEALTARTGKERT